MKILAGIALASLTVAGVVALAGWQSAASPTASQKHASYLANGSVALPADYRDWPFLSSGVNMNYSDASTPDHSMLDNVFVDPDALRVFRTTGTWPDGAVFVKEDRMGATRGSINKSGQYQSEDVMAMEMHVKDTTRFKGGWAFFMGDANGPLALLPTSASCYACHAAHGAVDTTFVQFYPTLIGTARKRGTLSAGYRQDLLKEGAPAGAATH